MWGIPYGTPMSLKRFWTLVGTAEAIREAENEYIEKETNANREGSGMPVMHEKPNRNVVRSNVRVKKDGSNTR